MKIRNLLTGGCVLGALLSTAVSATPVLGIGSMYDVITLDAQSMTKRIYNTGTSTAFSRVDVLEIDPTNMKGNAETPQKEIIADNINKNRLIVTPSRLIIPPGGFQSVRIIWPGDRKVEKYFRVRFTPVVPQANDSFGLDQKAVSEYRKNSLKAGVNVLTGYGTIVIVQPEKPVFNSIFDQSKKGVITVRNNGNTTISLDNIRQCKSAKTDCGNSNREFIIPGKSKALNVQPGYQIYFTLIEGGNKKELVI